MTLNLSPCVGRALPDQVIKVNRLDRSCPPKGSVEMIGQAYPKCVAEPIVQARIYTVQNGVVDELGYVVTCDIGMMRYEKLMPVLFHIGADFWSRGDAVKDFGNVTIGSQIVWAIQFSF